MRSRSANDNTGPRELAHSHIALNIRDGARLCDQRLTVRPPATDCQAASSPASRACTVSRPLAFVC